MGKKVPFMFKKKTTTLNDTGDKKLIMEAMQKIMDGDYAYIDTSAYADPALAEKFNELIAYFKKTNNNFVMRMNEAMEHIGDSSYVKVMVEQVIGQTTSIQEMTESSKELESSINDISQEVGFIKDNAQAAISVSQNSVSNMNETISSVEESVEEINSINAKVQDFHEKIDQITKIIDMVKKLASQSSLLALNASIEAARAGEAGKGFAVVANQVKELSSNTSQSAETVVKYVSELQESIGELIELVNHTTTHLKESNQNVQKSVEDINSMSEHMSLINDRIANIFEAVNTQSTVTNTFVKSIESIADSYEELQNDCISTGSHLYRIGRFVDTTRSDMARGFSELTTQDWLRVFQIDHLIFTWRVYNNLSGFEHLKITQLNNPKGCKLGKWACAQTDPKIINSSAFNEVIKHHNDVHKHACDSWYAAEDGDRETALTHFNATYESYQKFAKAIDDFKAYMKTIGYTDETQIVVFRN